MRTEPKVKASPASTVNGKQAWHGKYYADRQWHTVVNASDLPIVYATPEAACAAAGMKWIDGETTTLPAFRNDVLAILNRECFEPADSDRKVFANVFAHDTAHAHAHGIDAETVARRLIEKTEL